MQKWQKQNAGFNPHKYTDFLLFSVFYHWKLVKTKNLKKKNELKNIAYF